MRARVPSAVAISLVLIATCFTAAPIGVDPRSAPLLAEHGLKANGTTTIVPIEIEDPIDQPWSLYLEVSQDIGLDFSDHVGETAELRRTPIVGAERDAAAFVLVVGGQIVGAWVSAGGSSSGVVSLADHP